jgi:hypothetical protein
MFTHPRVFHASAPSTPPQPASPRGNHATGLRLLLWPRLGAHSPFPLVPPNPAAHGVAAGAPQLARGRQPGGQPPGAAPALRGRRALAPARPALPGRRQAGGVRQQPAWHRLGHRLAHRQRLGQPPPARRAARRRAPGQPQAPRPGQRRGAARRAGGAGGRAGGIGAARTRGTRGARVGAHDCALCGEPRGRLRRCVCVDWACTASGVAQRVAAAS